MWQWLKIQKVHLNNVRQQPVEEICHNESTGILSHHIIFDIANFHLISYKTLNSWFYEK